MNEKIIFAFWDVVIDALSNVDSVNLNGYATIGTKYMAERKSRNVAENQEITVPEHYRVYFKAESKLNQAAMTFTQKQLGDEKWIANYIKKILSTKYFNKISEKLIDEKIDIGGNGKKYKRKHHLKYTQKIIANVLVDRLQ